MLEWLSKTKIKPSDRVLEVGPGTVPFKRADTYVDLKEIPGLDGVHVCDVATEKLPFADKEFDFVYCRHTLEDMWNPFHLCDEMSRVAKAGYIETPSPMAELGRGVDGGSPPFRGYHHHRWIIWMANRELRFVTKYPFVEYLRFEEEKIEEMLLQPRYWNTHCLWEESINYFHRKSPQDFDIPRDYALMLGDAVAASKLYTDEIYFPISPV